MIKHLMIKTYQLKKEEVKRSWHLIDAKDQILGRLASRIAVLLMGKHRANYSPHVDSGDYVVVVNCEKFAVTGRKLKQKLYRRHSGYPGGFRELRLEEMLEKHSERVIKLAVSGMLPDNRLKDDRLARLKLVVGEKNPYESKIKK